MASYKSVVRHGSHVVHSPPISDSVVGRSSIHGTSTWRLQTEKLAHQQCDSPAGRGYIILSVQDKYLMLGGIPVATESPLPGDNVLIFSSRATAVIYAAMVAWDDCMGGRALHQYQIRSVHYSGASATYALRILDGPVRCSLDQLVQARTFQIPAHGNEKPHSSVLADPQAPPPLPRRLR